MNLFSNEKLNIEDKTNVVVITVSGSEEHLGRILDCNNNIYRVFLYKKHEIIGQNVKKLQPMVISDVHDDLISKAYKRTEFASIAPVITGEMKNQFLIQVYSKITMYPNLSDGIKLIGYFKETQENKKV